LNTVNLDVCLVYNQCAMFSTYELGIERKHALYIVLSPLAITFFIGYNYLLRKRLYSLREDRL